MGTPLSQFFIDSHDHNHLVTSVEKPTMRKSLSLINYIRLTSPAASVLVHILLLGSTKVHADIKNLHFTTCFGQ